MIPLLSLMFLFGTSYFFVGVFKLEQARKNIIKITSDFIVDLRKHMEEEFNHIAPYVNENIGWQKEFHKMMILEREKYPTDTVYGLSCFSPSTNIERLFLTSAPTLDKAILEFQATIRDEGGNATDWIIKGHTHLSFPMIPKFEGQIDTLNVANKIEKYDQKPLGIYVNYLQYAAERFATTTTEKKSIESIINKIQKNHAR